VRLLDDDGASKRQALVAKLSMTDCQARCTASSLRALQNRLRTNLAVSSEPLLDIMRSGTPLVIVTSVTVSMTPHVDSTGHPDRQTFSDEIVNIKSHQP
jgi:hypothetical protein